MRVEELMSRKVHTCVPQDPLNEAARILWGADCGIVVVAREDDTVAGVLTDRDVCMAAYTRGLPLHRVQVGEVMGRQVVTVGTKDGLTSACERMSQHQVRRLPVLDAQGRLAGLLSVTDLILAAAKPGGIPSLPAERLIATLAAISRSRDAEPTYELPAAEPKPALAAGQPAKSEPGGELTGAQARPAEPRRGRAKGGPEKRR